ncbi:hypothetical protein ACN2XU_12100 [Primorskyibacter sp. 2E107]|uniref:hypothetical protein n=1 Tax=Primorskyibacter sp. 2E107 TaxID=3403458 RepID=UPI003AF485E8
MFIVVGLIIAFILVALFSNRATRQCRWREYRSETDSRWTCITCGQQTRGPQRKAPQTCLNPDAP